MACDRWAKDITRRKLHTSIANLLLSSLGRNRPGRNRPGPQQPPGCRPSGSDGRAVPGTTQPRTPLRGRPPRWIVSKGVTALGVGGMEACRGATPAPSSPNQSRMVATGMYGSLLSSRNPDLCRICSAVIPRSRCSARARLARSFMFPRRFRRKCSSRTVAQESPPQRSQTEPPLR